MAIQQEERLSEVVRTYPFLYDKTDRYFKDKARKQLAWEDGRLMKAKETNLENGKFHSEPKSYFKALGSLLNTYQATLS